MTPRPQRKLRTRAAACAPALLFAAALIAVGCSSGGSSGTTSYGPSSSETGRSSNDSGSNSNYSSASGSNSNYSSSSNVSETSGYDSSDSSDSSDTSDTRGSAGVHTIDSPLEGEGDLTPSQIGAVNSVLSAAGATRVTVEEAEFVNQLLYEANERPSVRRVAQVVVEYRVDKLKELREARVRELLRQQQQQQAGNAPPGATQQYGGTPMYKGLSDSEKQAIWSKELPKDTQAERKAKIEP